MALIDFGVYGRKLESFRLCFKLMRINEALVLPALWTENIICYSSFTRPCFALWNAPLSTSIRPPLLPQPVQFSDISRCVWAVPRWCCCWNSGFPSGTDRRVSFPHDGGREKRDKKQINEAENVSEMGRRSNRGVSVLFLPLASSLPPPLI